MTILNYSPSGPNTKLQKLLYKYLPVTNRYQPGSPSTYLGGRPHLPAVVATTQHSERAVPLWTDSGNLGGERNHVRSSPHCPSDPLPSSPATSSPTLPHWGSHASEGKMPERRRKPSHPCRSPFFFRGSAHLPTTCPFPVPPPRKPH